MTVDDIYDDPAGIARQMRAHLKTIEKFTKFLRLIPLWIVSHNSLAFAFTTIFYISQYQLTPCCPQTMFMQ